MGTRNEELWKRIEEDPEQVGKLIRAIEERDLVVGRRIDLPATMKEEDDHRVQRVPVKRRQSLPLSVDVNVDPVVIERFRNRLARFLDTMVDGGPITEAWTGPDFIPDTDVAMEDMGDWFCWRTYTRDWTT